MPNSPQETQFKRVQADDLFALNHFLKQFKEPKIGKGDLAFSLSQSITPAQQSIIGSARLIPQACEHEDAFWLRGVFIHPENRHKGLGTELMQQLHQAVSEDLGNATIYAFPLGHLQAFYENLGYQMQAKETLPTELQDRFSRAEQQKKSWLCMSFVTNK